MSIKIAIVSSSTPPNLTGGISSAHWNLYLALKRTGYNVKVFTYNESGFNGEIDGDVVKHGAPKIWMKLTRIANRFYLAFLQLLEGPVGNTYQLFYVLNSMLGARGINRSLKAFCPDVLIIPDHGSPGYFITPPTGCITIFISHHNYLRLTNNPLIGQFSSIDAKLAMYFEHKTLDRAQTVICPSRYMKDFFTQSHHYSGKIVVIPNIVDQELIASIPTINMHDVLAIPQDSPIIYIPSAGTSYKGSRFVFEIIRRLSAASQHIGFYLTGNMNDDGLRTELEHLPENARLYCPGQTDYATNIAMIKGCSFCVSPTVLESFGMAILEANFCGIPVVAFNVGGNADVLINDINGYLVPFLDVEALISRSLMLMDKTLNETLASKTMTYVYELFATEKIVEQYANLISDVLDIDHCRSI